VGLSAGITITLVVGGYGEDGGGDPGGAGFDEGAGGDAEGGAGGGDIVDEADMFALDGGIGPNGEGAFEVLESVAVGHGGLGSGVANAQEVGVNGDRNILLFQGVVGGVGQELGLIVAAGPAAAPMQGDGGEHIGLANVGIADDGGGEHFTQEGVKVALAAEFEGENQFAQDLLIGSDADDAGNSGAGVLAAMTSIFDEGEGAGIVSADQAIITGGGFADLPPAIRAEDLGGRVNFIVTSGALGRA